MRLRFRHRYLLHSIAGPRRSITIYDRNASLLSNLPSRRITLPAHSGAEKQNKNYKAEEQLTVNGVIGGIGKLEGQKIQSLLSHSTVIAVMYSRGSEPGILPSSFSSYSSPNHRLSAAR